MRRGAVAALAVAASLGLAPAGAAAAGKPVNLGAILAPAPSSDYVEIPPGPVIDGAFDARVYAAYVTAINGSDESRVAPILERDGLKRGFGRSWLQLGTEYGGLYERVFEFATAAGAGQWLDRERVGNQALSQYQGPLRDAPPIPGSWSAQLTKPSGYRYFRVAFVKGNLEYEVTFGSGTADHTLAALHQAQAQYERAPRYTIAPSAFADAGLVNLVAGARAGLFVVAPVLAMLATATVVGVILIILWWRRPRPRQS
jgi:hypothetical protein